MKLKIADREVGFGPLLRSYGRNKNCYQQW